MVGWKKFRDGDYFKLYSMNSLIKYPVESTAVQIIFCIVKFFFKYSKHIPRSQFCRMLTLPINKCSNHHPSSPLSFQQWTDASLLLSRLLRISGICTLLQKWGAESVLEEACTLWCTEATFGSAPMHLNIIKLLPLRRNYTPTHQLTLYRELE